MAESPTVREPVPAPLVVATSEIVPADGDRRPAVRRRVLLDSRRLEGIVDRVVTRLPGAVTAGLEPLRAELAEARAALEEQSRLRMQAEARAASAERELEFLRVQVAEVAARPVGLLRRRPRAVVVVPQAQPQG